MQSFTAVGHFQIATRYHMGDKTACDPGVCGKEIPYFCYFCKVMIQLFNTIV